MRRRVRTALVLVAVLIGAGSGAGVTPVPGLAAPPAVRSGAVLGGTVPGGTVGGGAVSGGAARAITLITGDVVSLAPAGDGRYAATVRPAPGRESIAFRTTEAGDGLQVLPVDAVPLIKSGQLDAELFDVEHLLAEGYGDAESPALPLIVQSGADSLRTLRTSGTTALPSVGAVAVRADKKSLSSFWQSRMRARAAAPGKIWLDGRVRAAADPSVEQVGARAAADPNVKQAGARVADPNVKQAGVPAADPDVKQAGARAAADPNVEQIGAPAAWRAGLDGAGVTVAVLDTGVDATHPDLAGRVTAARDFSGSGSTADGFGHGTHVASIAAGGRGVAPGARLLVGKVLDDTGNGYESGIIEGMQWAVDSGARVINMSLGGSATDGTDPMSVAVDELSAGGALFVVAAGNEGGDYTVGTPGAATSALTVGAVDRDDRLAEFSSRGPRLQDQGLKPEITAPGVDIVAARAAGTAMGTPVDELYTAASGTSMATPHVAGAAAILAQQHPGWSGSRLKDGLVTSAGSRSDASVYGQGAGRVDLGRATTATVTGTGVADFGLQAVSRTVTYDNAGTTPVTLTLAASMPGVTAPATVTVPAGASAAVTLTLDRDGGRKGVLGGWLSATGPGGVLVTTALGGTVDPPHHRVTFAATGQDGKPTAVPVFQMFGDDGRFDILGYLDSGQAGSVDVAEGDYLVDATLAVGTGMHPEDTLVTIPELHVDRDLTVVLDARKARPIRIETPKPAQQQAVLSYYVHRVTGGGRQIDNGFMDFSATERVNVTPTAPLRRGVYEFSSRWQLVAPFARASFAGAGTYDLRPMPATPVFTGTRHYSLAATGRNRAVIVAVDGDEYEAVARAADAGAALVLLMRGPDTAAWSTWDPSVEERLPIPALLISHDVGTRVARAGSVDLTMTPDSPYLYDVLQVSAGRVPAQIVHRVTAANSYRVTSRYADNGGLGWVREQRFGWRPWQEYAWNDRQRAAATPSVREEWVSAGDSLWQHHVHQDYPWSDLGSALDSGFADVPRSYPRPGAATETWAGPVVRPATPAGYVNERAGNVLRLRVADFVDASDRHFTVDEADRSAARLYRDGTLISETRDAWRDIAVPAGAATYRLAVTTERGGDEWQYGRSTSTEWTFRSSRAGALPMLRIGYAAPVSLGGAATTRPHLLGVTVPGARSVAVSVSLDEGRSWRSAYADGGRFVVPAGTGTVSLRVTAADRDGNTVRQTVLRAYGRS
ncbi:peptidase [Actinoplanes cyaneus]|uniref:Peptidase n=1 Tax=Actinoplanes cyaneus TaxID=52696 RepID=A0A919IHU5_9ACTN|nr:S8 family peptidase [Actinoplanes cyaneus]MCW2142620.1 Serine protease, subtilisin family [Actinoplanes cyaneus]GID62170.1 peptidase [Actinoplanes cyaneus]